MRKNWLLLIIMLFLASYDNTSYAQAQKEKYRNKADDPVSKLPYYKKIRWADNLYKSGSYLSAIEYYQQLKMEQPRNPYLIYQLAECYWMTRDYVPAAMYFRDAYAAASKLYPEAKYKEGVMLKMQGLYPEAIVALQKFMDDNPKTYKQLKKRAQKEIDGCKMAQISVNDPVPVNVVNAGPNVNSAYTESAPIPLGDTALLFSTMRQNSAQEIDRNNRQDYMARFMVSQKQKFVPQVDSFQWPLDFVDGNFNDPKVHVSNGAYSPGGDRFYFTKCAERDSLKVECKIYVSKFDGSKWSAPILLGDGINEGGSNTHPSVAMVGKKEVLFFASNRTLQGRGGYDIWYSIIDSRNGTYRRPQNAGKQINTELDEVTPYYNSKEGKLYFASNGHVTMGGFDIFSADGGPSRYVNITNLGYPINTSADEMYFVKDNYGKPDAYVVSNRIGSMALKNPTCCDDIWRIQYEPKIVAVGKVINRANNELMKEVVVKMVNENGENKNFNSEDGNFAFFIPRGHSYVITGDKLGFASTRATINTVDVKRTDPDDTVYLTIYMDDINKPFTVSNVYYDFNKWDLRPESVASLDTLLYFMNDNPSLYVEVFSHTDGKGSPDYNMELGKKRAESVINYLISNGVDPSRMTARSMGEEAPVAPNEVGGKDNPHGRQLNRRTEFRVITDVPERRVLFDGTRAGVNPNYDDYNEEDASDDDGGLARPGSRLNKD
jgi:outer membrane protein OmpA-like peptidoglycan-associated protein